MFWEPVLKKRHEKQGSKASQSPCIANGSSPFKTAHPFCCYRFPSEMEGVCPFAFPSPEETSCYILFLVPSIGSHWSVCCQKNCQRSRVPPEKAEYNMIFSKQWGKGSKELKRKQRRRWVVKEKDDTADRRGKKHKRRKFINRLAVEDFASTCLLTQFLSFDIKSPLFPFYFVLK